MILTDFLILVSRFVEFSGAMILFGSSLFLLYGRPIVSSATASDLVWTKHLLIGAGFGLLVATVTGFAAQTAMLAGSFGAVGDPATVKAALLDMNFGVSSLVRLASALLAITAAVFLKPGRRLWVLCAGLGTIACASFAWMGHGAAEGGSGWVHLASDITHLLAAAGWIGALVVFWIVLARPIPTVSGRKALCASLTGFSGIGTILVAVIVASGLINSFFLVGWDPAHIVATRYGQVLTAKLFLFAAMLALATANRFRHTPHLAQTLLKSEPTTVALSHLRKSIIAESAAAAGVLALVSWLGTLAPVTVTAQ
jgi:putative copper resistance protein D